MTEIKGVPGRTELSTPPYARERFGMEGATMHALPRSKYLYFVKFVRNASFANESRHNNWQDGFSFLCKNVDRPQFNFETEVKNQYNKKRVIQTKINYGSSSMRFYDTTDDKLLSMIRDYLEFYYGDFKNDERTAWLPDQVEGVFNTPNGWGFKPPGGTPDASYFFEAIRIYQFAAGCYTCWEYVHPKISNFEFDSASYEDGDSSHEASMTFDHEGVYWLAHGEPIDQETLSTIYENDANGYNSYVEQARLTYATNAFGVPCSGPRDNSNDLGLLHTQIGGQFSGFGLGSEEIGDLVLNFPGGTNSFGGGALGAFGGLDFGESISSAIYDVVAGVAAGRDPKDIARTAISGAAVNAASEILGTAGVPQIVSGSVQRAIDLAIRQKDKDTAKKALILGAINQLSKPIAQRAANRDPNAQGPQTRNSRIIDNAIRQLGTLI